VLVPALIWTHTVPKQPRWADIPAGSCRAPLAWTMIWLRPSVVLALMVRPRGGRRAPSASSDSVGRTGLPG
jgi:hypothetical protein